MTFVPRQISTNSRMTLEEFLAYDDGTDNRYELVDGVPVKIITESTLNTRIEGFLLDVFYRRLGVPFYLVMFKHMVEVRRSYASAREPDLIVHTEESDAAMERFAPACLKLIDPNPRIVIEVVSPGEPGTPNYDRDYEQTPIEYADRGIPEMWQIDPERKWVKVGTLVGGTYAFQTFTGKDVIISPTFPNLNLTAEKVLSAGR
jgi:Uma2 family endonuclease